MKQTIFTFLFFTVIALVSCKKNQYNPDILQYDEDQITAYIKANGLTGMVRDTSGIYYKIITPGTGTPLQYTDSLAMVYSFSSFDGKYLSPDTIQNHFEDFMGHISTPDNYPYGLQFIIHNVINQKGAVARILIPSHLAYGVSGIGSGSSSVTNGKILGNQCLDYNIHIIANQDAYDQTLITKYISDQGLSSSMKYDPAGFWYSISIPGTGTVPITNNTTVTATYTLRTLNGIVVAEANSNTVAIDIPDIMRGMQIGLEKYGSTGALMSFIIPSSLAYGKNLTGSIPANSVLRYDIQIDDVTP
ncbi:FKBP-type peptidyl-prolyl cis-trans isomerase [Mucilaginibacter sp.]|uniref:FKBP-type peptidyl-prolyl cis-trans isomerase n=1 Tax=Mucilaginibacter sp. TaxID=1882438 RepID=UPI00260E8BB1|nr:FKBP-type peptidyl-prolyl cis-trans isomerase [Mucilaginibacter sp.]MDB5032553.1 hypothetical protein [Mucilaginibacter sp.]